MSAPNLEAWREIPTCVDNQDGRIVQLSKLFESSEVDIVGCIDRLGHAKDAVGHGHPAPQDGVVFNIVNPGDVRISG